MSAVAGFLLTLAAAAAAGLFMPMVTAGYSVWGALVLNLVENWYSQFITSYYLSLLFITSITVYYCLLPFITFITFYYLLLPFITFLYCLLLHITLYNLLLLFFTVYYFILPFITFCLFGLSSPPSWAVQPTLLGAVQPILGTFVLFSPPTWAVQPTAHHTKLRSFFFLPSFCVETASLIEQEAVQPGL